MASGEGAGSPGAATSADGRTPLGRELRELTPSAVRAPAYPPETLEGWYAVHAAYRVSWRSWRALTAEERDGMGRRVVEALGASPVGETRDGWTATIELSGSLADVLFIHFRPTLESAGAAHRALVREPLFDHLEPITSFLSVTEAGLYHATAEIAAARVADGGAVGDAEYRAEVAERAVLERTSPHVQRRLYPPLPTDMPYVCFYPMSKRRVVGQNWYELSLEERSRLMQAHGQTGRRYAGRVQQIITGAIGLDVWEWGVTLFARDPLDIKRLVTDMRFDEVSAQYAEFGAFYVGQQVAPEGWVRGLAAIG